MFCELKKIGEFLQKLLKFQKKSQFFLLKKGNILLQETFFLRKQFAKKEQVHPISILGCRR
jgi:hypothetical protein